MAWPTSTTVAAAAVITAAGRNALRADLLAVNGFVRKTADESVTSSIVLQNDDHLLYTIGSTGTYLVEVNLFAQSAANAAGDINVGWSFPTGTLHFGVAGNDNTLASGVSGTWSGAGTLSATSGTSALGLGLSTSPVLIRVSAILIATATGTLQFMWCQNTSNASASTVKSGSWMTVKQVA